MIAKCISDGKFSSKSRKSASSKGLTSPATPINASLNSIADGNLRRDIANHLKYMDIYRLHQLISRVCCRENIAVGTQAMPSQNHARSQNLASFKIKDYTDSYDEAHRRSPSAVKLPLIFSHFAIWHPEFHPEGSYDKDRQESKNGFRTYIETVLDFFDSRQPLNVRFSRELANDYVNQICHYYDDGLSNPNNTSSDDHETIEKLVFNFSTLGNVDMNIRLEVHREYLAVTIFYHIPSYIQAVFSDVNIFEEDVSPNNCLLPTCFQNIISLIQTLKIDFVSNATANFTQKYQRCVFADQIGIFCPINIISKLVNERNPSRLFPDVFQHGFGDGVEPRTDPRLATASQFLNRLMNQAAIEKSMLRGCEIQNMTASFAFCGHFLLISSAGYRQPRQLQDDSIQFEGDKSPSVFWLFYRDDVKSPALLGRNFTEKDKEAYDIHSRRAARVCYMLNVIGTTRIAALNKMKSLKDFSQKLRTLEADLTNARSIQESSITKLHKLIQAINEIEKKLGEPISYRCTRIRYYQNMLQNTVDDVTFVSIPGWLNVKNMLERRLYPQLDYLSGIAARHEAVLDNAATIFGMSTTNAIYRFQKTGDIIIPIIVTHYSAEIIKSVFTAKFAALKVTGWSEEMLALLGGLFIAFALFPTYPLTLLKTILENIFNFFTLKWLFSMITSVKNAPKNIKSTAKHKFKSMVAYANVKLNALTSSVDNK